jgi:hypothetical protein
MVEERELIFALLENVDEGIPPEIKKAYSSKKIRQEIVKKYGKNSFLDSENLKFPIVNPQTGQFDCKLIYAAFVKASIWAQKGSKDKNTEYYKQIKEKAKEAFKKNKCGSSMNITLSENEMDKLGLIDFFELSLLEFSLNEDEINLCLSYFEFTD